MAKKASKAGATARRRTNTGGTVKPKAAKQAPKPATPAGPSRRVGNTSEDLTRPGESTLTGLERERDEALASGLEQPHPQNAPRIAKTATVEPPAGRAHVNRNVEIDGEAGKGEILVRATTMGYYNHVRRREGDVFRLVPIPNGTVDEPIIDEKTGEPKERDGRILTKRVNRAISAEEQFSDLWMERVDGDEEEKVTTSKQALKAHHDELLAAKHAKGTGSADVI